MHTPALVPALMISFVALAAAHDRRAGATGLWLGMAIAFSGWALLAVAIVTPVAVRERWSTIAAPTTLLSASGTTLALAAIGSPHAAAGWSLAPVLLVAVIGAIGLIAPKLAVPRPLLLTQRIG